MAVKTNEQDQQDDQDQRPRLRRNIPIFGAARPHRADDDDDEPAVLLDWDGLRRKGIRYHRSYIRKMVAKGTFPRWRYLSARKIIWLESEIDDWIAAQLEEEA